MSPVDFHFPQEIIDLIVGFLHDDTAALISANTFSWAWHTSSRAHLFSTVTFAGSSHYDAQAGECAAPLRRYQLLCDLIQQYPDTAELVRIVKINDAHRLQGSAWPEVEDALASLLRQFTRASSISLNNVYLGHLSEDFLSTLLAACHSPSLHTLSFRCVRANSFAEIMFFCTGPKLRTLGISFVEADPRQQPRQILYDGMEAMLANPRRTPIALHSFHTEKCYMEPLVDWLLHPATGYDLSQFKELRYTHTLVQPNLIESVERLLKGAGAALEYLEMWAPSDTDMSKFIMHRKAFDLKLTPKVKQLRVAGLRFSRSICPIPCAKSLFEDCDIYLCIEEYQVTMDVVAPSPESLDWRPWSIFDEILTRPWFPKLSKVSFKLHVRTKRDVYGYERALAAHLPMLRKKGVLQIQTVD